MLSRRSHWGLDGVNFFIAAVQTGFGIFVTAYLVARQWPVHAIGLALTVGTLSNLVSQMPAGAFIDSLSDKRQAVRIGISGIGLAALLLGISSLPYAVYCALTLQGLASSFIGPGIASLSMGLAGPSGFSERIGRNARFASIGNGLTAAVMGLAGSLFWPQAVFLVAAFLTLPAFISLHLIERRHAGGPITGDRAEPGDQKLSWRGVRALLTDRRLAVFAASVVLFFTASAALLPGVVGQMSHRRPELASVVAAVATLLPQAIVAVMAPWVGRTADRSGRRPLLLLGWGLLPLQAIIYALLPFPWSVFSGQALNGLSSAIFGVMMTLVAADLTRGRGQFNLTLGILGVAIAIGASISTAGAGFSAAHFGAAAAYLSLALAGLCGTMLLWFGMPETRVDTAKLDLGAPSASR